MAVFSASGTIIFKDDILPTGVPCPIQTSGHQAIVTVILKDAYSTGFHMRYKAVTDDFNVALPKSNHFFVHCYYNKTCLKIHSKWKLTSL